MMDWTGVENKPGRAGASGTPQDLLAKISDPTNLLEAWDRVRRNNGCSGVDRTSVGDLEPQFPQLAHWLSDAIRQGRYTPKPLLRVEIPKPSGGLRKLAIPTVLDRVVQQAAAQVLHPLFEPHFSPHSFAYRPGRGPIDAVNDVRARLSRESWVLHLDIKSFFDSVPHCFVLEALRTVTTEQGVERLIQQTLQAGVYERGRAVPTIAGLPQGSPLSPVLANAVLHKMDCRLERRGALFTRYADDCVVLCDSAAEAERSRDDLAVFLAGLGLDLNYDKTVITRAEDAEFLSFAFAFKSKGECVRRIAPAAVTDLANGIDARAKQSGDRPEAIVRAAAELWRGWLGYFGATELPKQLDDACALARDRVRQSIWLAWSSDSRRASELRRRGALKDGARPAISCLRDAFPDVWFAQYGLEVGVASARLRACQVGYNGRFPGAGPAPTRTLVADTLKCWVWSLLRSGFVRLSVDIGRSRGHWMPRPRGIRMHLGRHCLRWRF